MTDERPRFRFVLVAALLMVAMLGLGARLAFLHLGEHPDMRARGKYEYEIVPTRGRIFDCRGKEGPALAMDLTTSHVCVNPKLLFETDQVADVASALASCLDLSRADVIRKVNRPSMKDVRVKRFVHPDTVELVRELKLPGVMLKDVSSRSYPQERSLCHVLGFVNHQADGSGGVEQSLDRHLRGSPGFVESRVNGIRQEMVSERGREVPALEGASVILTIDQRVQYIVEQELNTLMEEHNPKAAWAIVLRTQTGEVVAMASLPDFDPNTFNKADKEARRNRAISENYHPGSTMKAITIAAALNEGVVTPETIIDCENGSWLYGGRILRSYHPYGLLSTKDALKKSDNIAVAKIALKLGEKRMYRYFRDFGFGQPTGIRLPGEEMGILPTTDKWDTLSITRFTIGQGAPVTGLQMVNAVNAIANNGKLMRPHVVKRIVDNDGVVVFEQIPEVLSRPLTPKTAAVMRGLMARVTEPGGTGRRARVDGYRIAGKTGTAQKVVGGRYSSTAHMASFVGFFPADNPELTMLIVADEPQPVHTGGVVAAPSFGRIAGEVARCLDIQPGGRYEVAATAGNGRK